MVSELTDGGDPLWAAKAVLSRPDFKASVRAFIRLKATVPAEDRHRIIRALQDEGWNIVRGGAPPCRSDPAKLKVDTGKYMFVAERDAER